MLFSLQFQFLLLSDAKFPFWIFCSFLSPMDGFLPKFPRLQVTSCLFMSTLEPFHWLYICSQNIFISCSHLPDLATSCLVCSIFWIDQQKLRLPHNIIAYILTFEQWIISSELHTGGRRVYTLCGKWLFHHTLVKWVKKKKESLSAQILSQNFNVWMSGSSAQCYIKNLPF